MYTQRKIHSGLVGILFLLATAILFFSYARPLQQNLNELQTTVASLEKEIQPLREQKPGLIPTGTLSEVEQKDLAQAIPEHLDQDVIIKDISVMAKTADVSFNAIQFSLQSSADIPAVTVSTSFQGTAGNVKRFLKLIEGNARKMVVKDAGFSKSESAGGLALLNLNLTLQAYYRSDN